MPLSLGKSSSILCTWADLDSQLASTKAWVLIHPGMASMCHQGRPLQLLSRETWPLVSISCRIRTSLLAPARDGGGT